DVLGRVVVRLDERPLPQLGADPVAEEPARPRLDARLAEVCEADLVERGDADARRDGVDHRPGRPLRGPRVALLVRASAAAEQRIVSLLYDRLALKAPSAKSLVRTLSGGNQQKVVLGRWLAREPRVLLVDEPTRGIDVGAKREIYDVIHALAESGTAIVLVSSEMPELLGLCDRILVLRDGRLAGEFPRGASEEELVAAMAGSSHEAAAPTTGGEADG
ncbi:MAG: L-arabinose transport system ATP-binding protein, partial [bacterium]